MLLQKRNCITTFVQALLILCLLASCIDDKFSSDVAERPTSSGTPRYLALQLKFDSNPSATRADGEFKQGEEYTMGKTGNIAIFFKKNNKDEHELYGIYNLDSKEKEKDTDDYEEAKYLYIQPIAPNDETDFPTSCLVMLNGSKTICDKLAEYNTKKETETITADDILKEIWEDANDPKAIGYADADHQYITMTNSMYYDDILKPQAPTEFEAEKHIFQTIDSAKNDPIIVHVERMVSKFQFDIPKRIFMPIEPTDNTAHRADPLIFFDGIDKDDYKIEYAEIKKWRIYITGWGVNALETKSHLFKNAQPLKNTKAAGGYFDDWNSKDYFRSYWSEDPHYTNEQGKYPWQYRFAVEDNNIYYYSKANDPSPLKNYSYNDFYDETQPLKSDESGEREDKFDRVVYVPENTYGETVIQQNLDSRTNLLAGTHLIVTGELQIETDNPDGYKADDVYRDRNGVYYKSEKDCFVALVHAFNKTLESQETMKYVLYDWEDGGKIGEWTAKSSNQDDAVPMLYYKDQPLTDEYLVGTVLEMTDEEFAQQFGLMKEAIVQHGDGKRLPWFEDDKGNMLVTIKPYPANNENKGSLKIYHPDQIEKKKNADGTEGTGYIITYGEEREAEYGGPDASINDIKSLLYEWLGAVDHFNNGKMYYSVPIMHNAVNYEDKNDANQKTLGDFGVVRNHFYTFKLENVNGIGIPVDNPDDPIVPDHTDINDIINVKIYMIPWHVVEITAPVF